MKSLLSKNTIILSILSLVLLSSFAVPIKTHALFLDDIFGFEDPLEKWVFGDDGVSLPGINSTPDNYNYTINSNVNSPGASTGGNNVYGNSSDSGYYYDDYYYQPLSATCYPDITRISTGDLVTWRAVVTGGSGSVSISWNGTDRLLGSGYTNTKRYNSSGTKTAWIKVLSGNQRKDVDCSQSVYVSDRYDDDYDDDRYDSSLYVSCYPDDSRVSVGDRVKWTASVSGGTGSYRYDWDGTDGLSGSSRTIYETYDRTGTKSAEVTVRSGSRSVTKTCSPKVIVDGDDRYYDDYDTVYDNKLTCYADITSITASQPVTWIASYSGSNSYSNTFSWSGTDGLFGNGLILRTTYLNAGVKTAKVSMTNSRGQIISANCSNSVNVTSNYVAPSTAKSSGSSVVASNKSASNLKVSCTPDSNYIENGESITWTSNVSGGNGSYRYDWSGTNGLSGGKSVVIKEYTKNGEKKATLNVTSGSNSVTVACDDYVVVGEVNDNRVASALFAIGDMPWGTVSLLIIIILILTVLYLFFNRNKI